jgi:hypothetical protein
MQQVQPLLSSAEGELTPDAGAGYVGAQLATLEGRQLLETPNPNPRRVETYSANEFMGGEVGHFPWLTLVVEQFECFTHNIGLHTDCMISSCSSCQSICIRLAHSTAVQVLTRRLADTEDFPDIEQVNLDSIIDNPASDDEESTVTRPK